MTPTAEGAAVPHNKRVTGEITRIRKEPGTGYGFVVYGNREYFFHATAIGQELFALLEQGDRVSFVPLRSPKGPRAIDVERVTA